MNRKKVMKQWIYAIIGTVVLAVGVGFYSGSQKRPAITPPAQSANDPIDSEAPGNDVIVKQRPPQPNRTPAGNPSEQAGAKPVAVTVKTTSPAAIGVKLAVDTLVSPQASYPERQAAWKQLRDAGRLGDAIADLEQRVAASPQTAEYSAVLGQAYLEKAGTLQDMREQGILAMKADQTFDVALQLDPSNWDARFTKAVAMSYWPPQLNKGQEVIESFTQLINQQEGQAPQPQFAQSYVWLGDQYQKAGNSDYARQVWQRGTALYPNDTTLPKRLAQPSGK